ncbi:MAG: response regulator [Bryobacteraceae bacterium]
MTQIRVLVVEDNESDREWIGRALQTPSGSIETVFAETLDGAKHLLCSERIDAILLDMNLPDSQSLFSVTQITSKFQDVPVIVLSGNDADEFALAAIRNGAQDYLVKSADARHVLVRTVLNAIERNRGRRALRVNLLRDPQTFFLTEPAFRLALDVYFSATSQPSRLFIVHLDAGLHPDEEIDALTIDTVASLISRTFGARGVFGRLSDTVFAVLMKETSDDESILKRFADSTAKIAGNGAGQPLQLPAQILHCPANGNWDAMLGRAAGLGQNLAG